MSKDKANTAQVQAEQLWQTSIVRFERVLGIAAQALAGDPTAKRLFDAAVDWNARMRPRCFLCGERCFGPKIGAWIACAPVGTDPPTKFRLDVVCRSCCPPDDDDLAAAVQTAQAERFGAVSLQGGGHA